MEFIPLAVCLLCCVLLLGNRSSAEATFAVSALYVTLHFSYTVPALLLGGSSWAAPVAPVASLPAAKVAGVAFVGTLAGVIAAQRADVKSTVMGMLPMLIGAAVVILGFVFERCCRDVRWNDIAAVVSFFALAGLLSLSSLACSLDTLNGLVRRLLPIMFLVIVLSIGIAIIEIVLQRGAAQFRLASGEYLIRASAVFFNPNWFGAWLACTSMLLVMLGGSLRSRLLPPMFFSIGIAFFLTGSRGAAVLFLASGLLFLILRPAPRLPTLKAELTVLAGILSCAVLFSPRLISIPGLSSLATRWVEFPGSAAKYALSAGNVAPEFTESVSGRLTGPLRDNGFGALYDEAGYLALAAIVVFWLWLLIRTIFTLAQPGGRLAGATAASLLLFATLLSLQMRSFQVFPVWLVVAGIVAVVVGATAQARHRQISATDRAAT